MALLKILNKNEVCKLKLLKQVFPNINRTSHTDIKVPDFSKYRRDSVKNPCCSSQDSADDRKAKTNSVLALTLISSCYAAKAVTHYFIKSMYISADVQALAQIEVNLNDIELGGHVTMKWRGKPLFIKHRKPDEINDCRSTPLSSLRDPQTDEERCQNPDWLIIIGVCTHLGCVPLPNSGDFLGGYYCPCHGSHYDAAGRIRKGPAPTNMDIPEYQFMPNNVLVVG